MRLVRTGILGLIGVVYPWFPVVTAADFNYWYTYPEASQLAQQTGRTLMVYFWRHGCPYCEQMNTFVLSDPAVSQALERCFVVASVDSQSPEGLALARQLRALGTPTFVFLAPRENSWKETGRLFGSRPRAQFLQELQQVSTQGGGSCG
ncbi:thioredoxin family protein [Calidithermus timidus]|jgi:thioredoxin-related protein|uniref:thioredoxin family protein n=1 Tax=Calidithermus timidus TaxID=307124 RepID=UPI0003732E15|nr:thioredoxin family protein [Calidithermus timidus]